MSIFSYVVALSPEKQKYYFRLHGVDETTIYDGSPTETPTDFQANWRFGNHFKIISCSLGIYRDAMTDEQIEQRLRLEKLPKKCCDILEYMDLRNDGVLVFGLGRFHNGTYRLSEIPLKLSASLHSTIEVGEDHHGVLTSFYRFGIHDYDCLEIEESTSSCRRKIEFNLKDLNDHYACVTEYH